MGPQFNVFGKLKKMSYSEQINIHNEDQELVKNFHPSQKYPILFYGLSEDNYYKCSKRMKFGSNTEKEFSDFKKHLSYMTGFKSEQELIEHGGPVFFQELIRFDDISGVFGPIICNKLYNDFKDNFDTAESYFSRLGDDEKKYWVHYQNWCKALYVAKQNGAISIN